MVSGPEDNRKKTEDGRFIIVDGRRWRASDPSIPENLRRQLVGELMAARRAVGAARRKSDERAARDRVGDAKVALGERGEPWWEESSEQGRRARLASAMRSLLRARDPDSTICPSEPARIVGGEAWRELMPESRSVADEGSAAGEFRLSSRSEPIADAEGHSGPLRIGRGERFK